MTSDSDDLEQALQQNLKIRRELGVEVGKADGIQPAKQDRGMVYRLGWVLYWSCLLLAGAWALVCLWLIVTTGSGTPVGDIKLGQWLRAIGPSLLLYGLGRAIRYVLSAE